MHYCQEFFIFLLSFGIVALAARQIGAYGTRFKLPLISGFLLCGVVAGPFVLRLIDGVAVERLDFVNEVALAAIAFAAGQELHLKEFRGRFKGITGVTAGIVVATFLLGTLAVYLLSSSLPFMRHVSPTARFAAALVVGAIFVARSPSSAIAIVNELRAKGPFTQTVLGVTVISDAVVIVLFAISLEAAHALLSSVASIGVIALVVAEIVLSFVAGAALWQVLIFILSRRLSTPLKAGLIALAGYGVFVFTDAFRVWTGENWFFELHFEPLLICMIGATLITNASNYRAEFAKILGDMSLPIYLAFFTLTGASLALDVLARTWPIALAFFFVRLGAIILGGYAGGTLAGESARHNRVGWMAYITQAGIGIGLAKEVATEFPLWGSELATIVIAVIVLNQLVGPPLFKWAIHLVKEAHTRAQTPEFDGVRDGIIFTSGGGQGLTLARQLTARGWNVKVAVVRSTDTKGMTASDVSIYPIAEVSLEALHALDAEHADAVVGLLTDEKNYHLCELLYEHFGTETVVAQLHDRAYFDRFHELGVLIVDPSTAMVRLLEHFVLSPTATSILLGMEKDQDVIEVEVRDPDLDGVPLRNLTLPHDTLVLSVHRDGHTLISHGYTQLKLGDRVTVVGLPENLDEITLLFDAYPHKRESCDRQRELDTSTSS